MVALGTGLSGAACAAEGAGAMASQSFGSGSAAPQLCWVKEELDAACLRILYQQVPRLWPVPTIDPGQAWQEWGPVPGPGSSTQPEAAKDAKNKQIVSLGSRLFFDKQLSRKKQISCASCHQPDKSFTDGKASAVGEDGLMGKRRTPPLFAAPFAKDLFWDGRAQTLQEQVVGPIENPVEMNHALSDLIQRLQDSEDYRHAFQQAFGGSSSNPVDAERLARALAAYVVTIRPATTRFDDFLAGGTAALSDQELIGLHLFRTKARCMNCHNGPMLTDNDFHNIGLSFYGRRLQDLGRFEWTRNPSDLGLFRTPSLRNVSKAGPWMHNGLFPSLDGLLRMYDVAMGPDPKETGPLVPRKSERIRELNLSDEEIQALLAFLQAL
ncbi:cytochrome-c peroxidase [Providencia rettgeri]|nr:cytochrome-c peroxidase [Providencia rettgeri]